MVMGCTATRGVTNIVSSASSDRVAEMHCVEEGFTRRKAADKGGRRVESGGRYPSVKY
jgi:hypothetical protein